MSNSVPEGWYQSKLGVVADLIMGQSPPSNTYNNSRIGLPFFQGKTDFGSHYPSVRVWCSKPTKVAEKDSILFSVRAPVGDINIASESCCIGRGLAAIKGTKVEQAFLYQTFKFVKHRFQLLAQGSTFEAVSGGEMRDFKLILPPLPEQKKIAAILTSVDTVIEKTQAQIDKLKDLKTGMMQELLTKGIGHTEFKDSPVGRIPVEWEVATLGESFSLLSGSTPSRKDMTYFSSDQNAIPWVKTLDLNDEMIKSTDEKITERAIKNSSCKKLPIGTALIAMYGGWNQIGRSGVLSIEATTNQAICALKFKGNVLGTFANYWLISNRMRWKTIAASSRKDPNITKQDVSDFLIAIPSLKEQESIIDRLDSATHIINLKCNKLISLKKIKKALMQDLLTGKVRVKL